jgi:uncharacterized membrane protein (DUF4010 family)
MTSTEPPARRPRPTWVVVLAIAMLIYGGHLLVTATGMLRGVPPSGLSASGPASPAVQELAARVASGVAAHPVAVTANALSKLIFALLLLYAVAAVLSADPRARGATLLAAWAGILHQFGEGLFLFLVVWPHSPSDLVSVTAAVFLGTGLLGVAFSVLLLSFFGGRRGRVVFGPQRQPRVGHGG